MSDLKPWQHEHVFRQDQVKAGEKRTLLVAVLTAVMMVVEIVAGLAYGSMALLADGLHMASHATALGIAVLAYVLARRYATDSRFTFGTGKVNSLAGFASAVLLLGFAVVMVTESIDRLIDPVIISFNQAIVVAVFGLVVNGISAWVLVSTPHHEHDHDDHRGHVHHHDHNLRAAYLHVLADALTSVFAIVALLAGKYTGANWLDPAMGIVGAVLIARWSLGLIRDSAQILLDRQAGRDFEAPIRRAIEASSTDRISDLHVWQIGHEIYAAEIAIVTSQPKPPQHYKSLIPQGLNIVHATVEVHGHPQS
ncbi:MAG: CDF family Co(II)/Ni(II) efflux transporter DmeF [Woeseiaceae bacterium]|nr:CDF family Co(II)/Ni(II) efflux transporter DmeF [Woeseiaceae bacterium]